MTVTHRGEDVLPWFQPVSETTLAVGTRLVSFADYHRAPIGTRTRLGRKGGIGQVLVKRDGAWWPEDSASAGITAYGLEGRPSYTEMSAVSC